MEKYYVEINNEEYEVLVRSELEAKGNSSDNGTVQQKNNIQKEQKHSQSKQSFQQNQTSESTSASASSEASGNTVPVESPMSGSILSIEADVGDHVEKDEIIIIIEAMKMETEIFAPASGELEDINAVVGDHCDKGEELAVIRETGGN